MKSTIVVAALGSVVALATACFPESGNPGASAARAALTPSGALIGLSMDSTVGVLLDELPAGPVREAAAANALAQSSAFWVARAQRQTRLTSYRLVFRSQYYNSYWSNTGNVHGPLPLPPASNWNVTVKGPAHRVKVNSHDLVVVDYTFSSTILTDAASPAQVEHSLGTVGGTWDESFSLPIDPELLLQRTGYACMDEDEFPPGSVFEENTYYFYDDACNSSPGSTCHVTVKPNNNCNAAVGQGVGGVNSTMHFQRLAYSSTLANAVRVGTITPAALSPAAPDLAVVPAGLTDEHAIAYRFFTTGSCELGEGVISQLGWRRLLMFSAIVRNDGASAIEVGSPTDSNNPYVRGNAFEFSSCHGHYHFSHYGTFGYAGLPGSKRAFCLEDTNRYHNDETTVLWATHQTCQNQGIVAGWGDEYNFGIPGQWVDITSADTKKAHDLSFLSNPDQFLCEGIPAVDAQGNVLLDPTSFINPWNGLPESRIRCGFISGWNANNYAATSVSASGGGSFVTDACTRGQLGPNRDCGFAAHPSTLHSCTPGATVNLSCTAQTSTPQIVRICEKSGQLGVGVACPLATSTANVVVGSTPTAVSFTCPAVRDAAMVADSTGTLVPQPMPGVGAYSVYQAAIGTLSASDASPQPAVSCTGW